MLRPTRRQSRSLLGILAVITSVGLIWPAGIAAGGGSSGSGAPSAAAPKAGAERAPTVRGLGTRSLDAGRGHGPSKPLETLKLNRASRAVAPTPGDTPNDVTGVVAPPPSATATQNASPAATSLAPWEGLDQVASTFEPPDPWVAVGPDDVVQTVNNKLRFTNREGVTTSPDLPIFEFFDLANFEVSQQAVTIDGISDPRWLYDAKHGRWLAQVLGWHCDDDGAGTADDPVGFVFGAISITGDPTGDYYNFFIQYIAGIMPDYPMIGTSADKISISANEFTLNHNATNCTAGTTFEASSVTTLDWVEMLTFPALPDSDYYFDFDNFSWRPAVQPKGLSNTVYVVGEAATAPFNVKFLRITGTNAAANISASAPEDLTVAGIVPPFVDPPVPDDPGGTALDGGIVDQRPTDAIWQDGVLTFASTAPCAGNACARVTQLNTGPATPTLRQDFLIPSTPAGGDTWFPGVGLSQSGILHVVYTQSSNTEGMSSVDRYQLRSDALNTLSAPREIADGGALAYGGDRWGDYVGVAQDPRDTNAVWQANQYTKSATGTGNWGTKVGSLQTAGSTFVPIAPVRVLDSRVNNGTTGPFTSSVPKIVDIAGRLAIPANAVAITGNLAVVGQEQAGYVALTPLPVVDPTTSTINFPVGVARANNITSPLSNTGDISLTYKAGAGKRTQLVLDVTGYFLNDATGQTYNVVAPFRLVDTRIDLGLTNALPANVNRQFDVAGQFALPANATAITGNLAVANQTQAGYVTLATNAPPATPANATINFAAGGPMSNGFTVKLSATGSLWVVYKAAPGQTTHLIIDVSGYYLNDLTGARFVPLTPGRRMDTRFPAPQEGLTGAFVREVSRTLVIEPYQGVPSNATAIVGNLAVVGQTREGYVSMTPTPVVPPAVPPVANLNFPVGDIRANGVTGPLSGPGNVAFIYKAGGGGVTHLVFDLNGYFRP